MLTSESKQPYLAAFKQMRTAGAFAGPAWLEQLRQEGITSFDGLGFPTLKNEDWKYTNVEPIASQSYVQANGEVQSVGATDLLSRALVEANAPRLRRTTVSCGSPSTNSGIDVVRQSPYTVAEISQPAMC